MRLLFGILLFKLIIRGGILKFNKIVDTHVHTDNSFDGNHSATFMCETAEKMGLRAVVFTDHVEIDLFKSENYFKVAKQAYFEVAKARSAFRGQLLICAGVELGQPAYDTQEADRLLNTLNYDQVIGTVHNLRGQPDFYFLDYNVTDVHETLLQYFEELKIMVDWGDFDTLGHLTYPLRYIQGDRQIPVDLSRYARQIDYILKGLVEKEKALEINTSGLRQNLKDTMPSADIVRRFKELGGQYITIGSDAHRADHLGAGVREGMTIAQECGFDNVTLFQKREPVQIPIK
ncbi:MAG: histidinol-phosphatase HisJ family protein [Clostridiales bacterium]|nr:histidinol-phosphatase HisJ family protein [Clostridiales bacterium]